MTVRHATATVVLASVVLATAGCATTVSGTPQAGTTIPTASSSVSTSQTSASGPLSSSPSSVPSSPTSPAPVTSSTPPVSSSIPPIRPMPPLKPTSGGSVTSGPTTSGAGGSTIGGVSLDDVLGQLGKNHVAIVDSSASASTLVRLVDGARSNGLNLSVVSIGSSISDDDTSAIGDQVFQSTGGTLLVLSPTQVVARSDELSDTQRAAAVKAAAQGSDDAQAVTKFIASALSGGAAPTSKSTPPTTSKSLPPVGGIDVSAIVAALGPDHIAIASGVTGVTAGELSKPVQKAWGAGLKIYVALLDKDATGHLSDVADAVMSATDGTVFLVSPGYYAISSQTLDNTQLQAALDAAGSATSYVDLVTAVINTLLK